MGEASQSKRFEVLKSLNFEDVRWAKALEVLSSKFGYTFSEADRILKSFFKRFLSPMNMYWFLNPKLSQEDNKLLACMCEVHGTDALLISHERLIQKGPIRIAYNQIIEFDPKLSGFNDTDESGVCVPRIEICVMGRSFMIVTALQALLVHFVVSLGAVLSYVLIVGLLLYGFSVLIMFGLYPADSTIAATQNGVFGLALLGILMALSAVFGKAFVNLSRLALQRYRAKTKNS